MASLVAAGPADGCESIARARNGGTQCRSHLRRHGLASATLQDDLAIAAIAPYPLVGRKVDTVDTDYDGSVLVTRLDVPELQARYLEVVGRPTGSTNKAYMVWKIREAQKGRVPVGPRKNAHREGVTFKVLPLRMEAAVVEKLDEAWRSRGIKSRTEFFRGALGHYIKQLVAEDAAALFADGTPA